MQNNSRNLPLIWGLNSVSILPGAGRRGSAKGVLRCHDRVHGSLPKQATCAVSTGKHARRYTLRNRWVRVFLSGCAVFSIVLCCFSIVLCYVFFYRFMLFSKSFCAVCLSCYAVFLLFNAFLKSFNTVFYIVLCCFSIVLCCFCAKHN